MTFKSGSKAVLNVGDASKDVFFPLGDLVTSTGDREISSISGSLQNNRDEAV